MASFKEPVRDYKFSDARLIEISNEKIGFAERDATELATVGITTDWVDGLQEKVTAFTELPSDEVELGEQEEATDEKNTDADLLLDKLKELRSAAKRAFGEKHGDYKQFALKELDDMKDNELLKAAVVARGVALTHAAPLLAKGWDTSDNDELQTFIDDFGGSLKNKSIEIGSRDSATENRILKGNELYALLENELCEAAKSYWRTRSEAKYNDYIIYNTPSGSNTTTVMREGDVPPSGIVNINVDGIKGISFSFLLIEIAGSPLKFYAAVNTTDAPGTEYYQAEIGNAPFVANEFAIATGFGPDKPFLNVQNPGTVTAHYKLTFSNPAP